MLKRLLYILREPNTSFSSSSGSNNNSSSSPSSVNDNTLRHILYTIRILLIETNSQQNDDLVKFGQYLAALLPDRLLSALDENDESTWVNNYNNSATAAAAEVIYRITLRNRLLSIVDEIVALSPPTNKSIAFQEELQRTLGYDWFLLFMQPHVHRTTLVKSVKILFTLLLNVQNLNRFKESSTCCAGWLANVYIQPVNTYLLTFFLR